MEKQVRKLIKKGFSQRKIAEKLQISRHQVRIFLGYGQTDLICIQCGSSLNTELGQHKYCSQKCKILYERKEKEIIIESKGELPEGTGFQFLRRYLIDKCDNTCSVCNKSTWNNKPIPLVIDHIDGNPTNNSLKNLRVVCCNCDAQLPTYKGKNRGNGRFLRRQKYAQGKSF